MRNSGERLRQLLNINNPDNTIQYEDEQFERKSSIERISSSSSPIVSRAPVHTTVPITVHHTDQVVEAPEMPGTPTSEQSTLQASGHRLIPRPHVSLLRPPRVDTTNTGFAQKSDYDGNLSTRQLNGHYPSRIQYYQDGMNKVLICVAYFI